MGAVVGGSGALVLTDCACIVVVCVWDAADNKIGDALSKRLASVLDIRATAALAAARCRLAFAKGCSPRLCEVSVLAGCPVDFLACCATACTTRLVLCNLMAQFAERSGATGETTSVTAVEEGVPPVHGA